MPAVIMLLRRVDNPDRTTRGYIWSSLVTPNRYLTVTRASISRTSRTIEYEVVFLTVSVFYIFNCAYIASYTMFHIYKIFSKPKTSFYYQINVYVVIHVCTIVFYSAMEHCSYRTAGLLHEDKVSFFSF